MPNISEFLKAIYAGLAAFLASLGAALVQAGSFNTISDAVWITIASATVLAFGAVYGVTNSPPSSGTSGGT